ncbi:U1 small nuclear ribonucleoprotein C-1-like [Schistocerca americana]|uniref:U1 small nuclear ribonucleoprotein C-1-like n=1 Tax=Schistocerca americana TaxID=7009 RepID=UPI001F4F7603|nr:U1 small nuclear ribonucleoprotein C-1-like [Schistocerca americana]
MAVTVEADKNNGGNLDSEERGRVLLPPTDNGNLEAEIKNDPMPGTSFEDITPALILDLLPSKRIKKTAEILTNHRRIDEARASETPAGQNRKGHIQTVCLRKRKNNSSAAQPMDIHVLQSQPAQKVAFKDSSTVRVGTKLVRNQPPTQPSAMRPKHLVRGGFQPRLPTSLPPPGQQQQPSPLPRRQPVPLMPPAQLHPGGPPVVAPAPAVPLHSPPPPELMDVDPSAGPPSQAVAVQPVLQPLSLGTPKESDPAAPCPAPTQQPSTQRQETLPLFVGPDASSRPVPEAAPVVTGFGFSRATPATGAADFGPPLWLLDLLT